MSKKEIYELISDYLDGNMSNEELKDFELKIDNESSLKKEIEDIKNLIQDIKKTETLRLPNDFDYRLKKAIDRSELNSRFSIFKLFDNPVWTTVGSVAATVLLVVTVSIFFSNTQKNNTMIDSSEIAFEDDVIIKDDDIEIHQAKSEKLKKLK